MIMQKLWNTWKDAVVYFKETSCGSDYNQYIQKSNSRFLRGESPLYFG
jgi:hypothetical protein